MRRIGECEVTDGHSSPEFISVTSLSDEQAYRTDACAEQQCEQRYILHLMVTRVVITRYFLVSLDVGFLLIHSSHMCGIYPLIGSAYVIHNSISASVLYYQPLSMDALFQ